FIAVNDLHYLNEHCAPWFEQMVKQMSQGTGDRGRESEDRSQGSGVRGQKSGEGVEKIDFCLIVGDLADHGTAEQFRPLREILKTLPFPFHAVIGNHDHCTQKDRRPYEDMFPGSLNYHFEHNGWQFVGLDSSEGQKTQVEVQPPTLK